MWRGGKRPPPTHPPSGGGWWPLQSLCLLGMWQQSNYEETAKQRSQCPLLGVLSGGTLRWQSYTLSVRDETSDSALGGTCGQSVQLGVTFQVLAKPAPFPGSLKRPASPWEPC